MAVLAAERPSSASTDEAAGAHAVAPAPQRTSIHRWRRRGAGVAVVLVIAVAIAGRTALVDSASSPSVPAPGTSPVAPPAAPLVTSPPTPASAAQAALDQVLPGLRSFVEQQRHLQFTSVPKTILLDDAEFVKRLDAGRMTDEERAAVRRLEEVLKAMGLLTPDADLAADQVQSSEEGVLGFYDPETKELVVRSNEVTPYARQVLVHELTHALDDQHFGLARPQMAETVEDHLAFRALTEGDAVRVQRAYVASLNDAERTQMSSAEQAIRDRQTVETQTAYYFNAFPYLDGPSFVTALAEAGGEDAVDAAFADPPRSTAEILIPERYRLHLRGARLSAPAIGAPAFDSGVVGALGLFLMLQSAVPIEDAARAAASWEGDLYVAWHDGSKTCVKARFLLDTPWDAAFTARVLDIWSRRQVDAHVEAPGTVIVQSCR
jgi:hypothetical protein